MAWVLTKSLGFRLCEMAKGMLIGELTIQSLSFLSDLVVVLWRTTPSASNILSVVEGLPVSIPRRMPNVPDFASASGISRKAEQARPQMSKRRYLGPTLIVLHWHDVAGLGFIIEMHLDSTGFEMAQHSLDPLLDRRMVCTVARDEFLDNGPQRSGGKLCVRYSHGKQLSANRSNSVPSIDRD